MTVLKSFLDSIIINKMILTFFLIFFIGFFVFILFTLSEKGWAVLVDVYPMEKPFQGHSIGFTSARINGVFYRGSLILKYNQEGFYLRPIFIFRLFHKPIFIPWKEIKDVSSEKILFVRSTELVIGEPGIASIRIIGTTFWEIAKMMNLKGNF